MAISVAGTPAISLLDTSACRSLVSLKVWRRYCKYNHIFPVLERGEVLRTVDGSIFTTLGKTTVEVEGHSIPINVVRNLKHALLLGDDALRCLDAEISYKKNLVSLADKIYQQGDVSYVEADPELAELQAEIDFWEKKFPAIFDTSGTLGTIDGVCMKIDTGDARPINQRPYRLPLTKRKIVDEQIDKMLDDDVIDSG